MSGNNSLQQNSIASKNLLMSTVSGALFGGGIAGIFMASYYFIDEAIFNNPHDNIIFYLIAGACAIFASSEIKKLNQ